MTKLGHRFPSARNELLRSAAHMVALVLIAAALYFITARIGYLSAIPQGIVTLWPPAGVTLGLLALNQKRNWPALLAGAFIGSVASDLRSGYPTGLAFAAAAANCFESLVAASVLTWRLGARVRLSNARAVLTFAVGAVVLANALTACFGALMLHNLSGTPLGRAWFVWWVGDGMGMLIVAPVLLALADAKVARSKLTRLALLEGACLTATLIITAQIALGPPHKWVVEPGPYVVFPLLFWAASRFGQAGAALASLIVAAIATWNAALGVGPFVLEGPFGLNAAMQTYVFLAVATLSALIAAAVLNERTIASEGMRAAEDRMRFALEASRAGVWDVDFITHALRWSESLERLHGLGRGSFGGTNEAFLDLVHADDRATVAKALADATEQHLDAQILYRSVWPDGSVHWISGIGRTSYDAAGNPISATGISLDVTERRNLEEQYRQSQKMEAIGQLAGGVAHDFNNVLTAIQGYTSLVTEALSANSPLQPDLAEIAHGVKRAAGLTRQLLAFSRRQVLTPTILNLADSLRGMESMLNRLIGEHIEVIVQTAPDTGHVRADAGQMEQVILNLALNARDAMPDGGTLVLEVMNVDARDAHDRKHIDAIPGPCVMLAVTDSGIGMDAATLSRIFEPFFTTKPQDKGTGLGLATVYGIVRQSEGRVWVYSEPGRGSTFKIYLPRVDAPLEQMTSDAPLDVRVFSETVLLVEDDAPLRLLARRTLESRGYIVLAAATPGEALEIVDKYPEPIHLLLTDVVLPEMSGPVLAEQIEMRRADTRVLYMSGYTDDAVFRRGVLERHVHFIQKPFAQEALLRKIRDVLEGPLHN